MLTDDDVQRLNDQACDNNHGRQGEWDELNEDGKAWARELARLAHEQGCRDTVASAIGAAGRLQELLPGVPLGTLHSEIAADEIERLRAELVTERATRAHVEQAAELLRRCERSGTAPRHSFDLQAIHAEMSAWWERDQASANLAPKAPGPLVYPGRIGKVEALGSRYPSWLTVYVWLKGTQPGWAHGCNQESLLSLHLPREEFRGLLPDDDARVTLTIELAEKRDGAK